MLPLPPVTAFRAVRASSTCSASFSPEVMRYFIDSSSVATTRALTNNTMELRLPFGELIERSGRGRPTGLAVYAQLQSRNPASEALDTLSDGTSRFRSSASLSLDSILSTIFSF